MAEPSIDGDIINDEALNRATKTWKPAETINPYLPWGDTDSTNIGIAGTPPDKPLKDLRIEGECNYLVNNDKEIQLEGTDFVKGIMLRYRGLKIVISAEDYQYIDITEDDN